MTGRAHLECDCHGIPVTQHERQVIVHICCGESLEAQVQHDTKQGCALGVVAVVPFWWV